MDADAVTRDSGADGELGPRRAADGQGPPADPELVVQGADGTTRRVRASALTILDERGAPVRLVSSELASSERSPLEHSPICHTIVDLDFKLRYMNTNGFRMLRLDPIRDQGVIGRPYPFDFFPGASRRQMLEELERVRSGRARRLYEGHARDAEGNELWLHHALIPVLKADGALDYITVVSADITERMRAEDELRRLERRSSSLLDYSPVCHKIVDLDFKLRYMNANGFKMLKLTPGSDLYGKPYPFDFFPEEARRTMRAALEEIRAGGRRRAFEGKAQDVEGNDVWLYHTLIPVPKDSGALDYITVVSADVTEQKRMQQSLLHAEKMDAIGQLAGGVAHDFNNQLAVVLGYGDMLASRLPAGDLRKYAEQICAAASRSMERTKSLLTFSRKAQRQSVPVRLHEVVRDTIDMLTHTLDKRIQVDDRLLARRDMVLGDSTQLQNALLNLSLNARDAMPQGGRLSFRSATVRFDERSDVPPGLDVERGWFIELVVADTGLGIPKEIMAHVFEPFFTTKPKGVGTGLGLASVYGTILDHHGSIELDSVVGEGTTFKIYLPLSEEEQQGEQETQGADASVSTAWSILFVDDEQPIRELVNDMLTSAQHSVSLACDGEQALRLYEQRWRELDLVIMDMNMPRMNGAATFRAMKRINPEVRVIIASGYSQHEDIRELVDEGVVQIVQKPFRQSELCRAVEDAMQGAPAQHA